MLDAVGVPDKNTGERFTGARSTLGFKRGCAVGVALLTFSVFAHSASSVDYTYDALGRVVKAVYSDGTKTTTVTYNYDASGNRTTVTSISP
ncbi:RHS repeat domain-containing protein [Burkholderia ubonensis]|uniref:RHS repeat domain-containing protein n=1 Tax=Burkholderia ubonensis TaxID=101571 RepID=UPI000AD71322|nr:RHS repeat domain-containing protein [Burkholderia ubonensis]